MTPAQLENVAQWLDNGCDPRHAATELRMMANLMRLAPEPEGGGPHYPASQDQRDGLAFSSRATDPSVRLDCPWCGKRVGAEHALNCDRPSPEPAGTASFNVTRYKVVQDKGEYCLKGCPDGDLVDFSAYAALLNGCTTPTKAGSES